MSPLQIVSVTTGTRGYWARMLHGYSPRSSGLRIHLSLPEVRVSSPAPGCSRLDLEDRPVYAAGWNVAVVRCAIEVVFRVQNHATYPLPIRSLKGVQHRVLPGCIDFEYDPAARGGGLGQA